jgi:AraC family transcriptional regulator of adaptative response/methylated-DNA-[protein]-cysteine methyltransferase
MARARLARDASYDGVFWVCVRSTGIFCRPSCTARMPLEANVAYARSVREALLEGFRPCKRCRPMETDGRPADWIADLLRLSETHLDQRLRDSDIRALGVDPVRARRHFIARYGMTFHAYHRARRLAGALGKLKGGEELLAAGLDHGYSSDSGFREAFARRFRTTPGRSDTVRQIFVTSMESPVGRLELGATDDGVCLIEFADRRALPTELAELERRLGKPVLPGINSHLEGIMDELERYFSGTLREFSTPLDIVGTLFQTRVWKVLCEIPYGRTLSYGQLAEKIGRPGAQRAVGQANGANHIAIVIPCHRVVQSDGQLRGYGGGLWRKQFLLDLEQGQAAPFGRESGELMENGERRFREIAESREQIAANRE